MARKSSTAKFVPRVPQSWELPGVIVQSLLCPEVSQKDWLFATDVKYIWMAEQYDTELRKTYRVLVNGEPKYTCKQIANHGYEFKKDTQMILPDGNVPVTRGLRIEYFPIDHVTTLLRRHEAELKKLGKALAKAEKEV